MVILVIGVSGSGKSSFGSALSKRMKIPYYYADDFHTDSCKWICYCPLVVMHRLVS